MTCICICRHAKQIVDRALRYTQLALTRDQQMSGIHCLPLGVSNLLESNSNAIISKSGSLTQVIDLLAFMKFYMVVLKEKEL